MQYLCLLQIMEALYKLDASLMDHVWRYKTENISLIFKHSGSPKYFAFSRDSA